MKKNPHVIWVCPNNDLFFRSKGAVKPRANSVLPKLIEHGLRVNVLIPFNPVLLPKTKLAATRTIRANVRLIDDISIQFIKLSKGDANPGVFMLKAPAMEAPLESAVFTKAAIRLAELLKRPVDIFHVFNWNTSLLPLFIELEKNEAPMFKNARTFLNISSIGHEGNFSPTLLSRIGVPEQLFHPEGIEFYGKVSYLKTGLLFSDGIGLVDGRQINGAMHNKVRSMYEGIFEMQMHKLRHWPSDRSVKAHLDAYYELLRLPKPRPLLATLLKKLHTDVEAAQVFINSWGPMPRERYGVNRISLLVQAPKKAYALWEWNGSGIVDFGVVVDRISQGQKELLSKGLDSASEFWFSVEPDQEYAMELVGWTSSGEMKTLLRSPTVRTPRESPSSNTMATFVDVDTKERFQMRSAWQWGRPFTPGSSELFGSSSGRWEKPQ